MFKKLNFNEKEKKKLIGLLIVGALCVVSLVFLNFVQDKQQVSKDIQDDNQVTKQEESEEQKVVKRMI